MDREGEEEEDGREGKEEEGRLMADGRRRNEDDDEEKGGGKFCITRRRIRGKIHTQIKDRTQWNTLRVDGTQRENESIK